MRRVRFFFLALHFVLCVPISAFSDDTADRTVYLEADQVDIDDKQGISTYVGNVKMTRGLLTVTADKMTVYRSKQELQKVIAIGTPVRIHQHPDATTKEVHGEGARLEYDATTSELLLSEQAKLTQENNEFSGNFIRYNVDTEFVKAGKGATQDQRVRVIIHPAQNNAPQK